MSYFRKTTKFIDWGANFNREQKWLVLINADPDAMASAMALKRMIRTRVGAMDIAKINSISRPDNLAMIRYTRLHMLDFTPELLEKYTHFAMVDSQPKHNEAFSGINFSIIIDHHPPVTEPQENTYIKIAPEYGSTSTMMTEFLYNMDIRPGNLLATALQFGIRTDTSTFQRNTHEVDLRAYLFLNKFADQNLLKRIMRSEFHLDWLPFFAKAATNVHKAGNGYFIYVGEVDSPDLLVGIADFFTRVYEVRSVSVAGYHEGTVVVIFRSDSSVDVGRVASSKFSSLGSAGGHRTMARAEFPLTAVQGKELELFLLKRLISPAPRVKKTEIPDPAAVQANGQTLENAAEQQTGKALPSSSAAGKSAAS